MPNPDLENMSLSELRAYCRSKGIYSEGIKRELIDRIHSTPSRVSSRLSHRTRSADRAHEKKEEGPHHEEHEQSVSSNTRSAKRKAAHASKKSTKTSKKSKSDQVLPTEQQTIIDQENISPGDFSMNSSDAHFKVNSPMKDRYQEVVISQLTNSQSSIGSSADQWAHREEDDDLDFVDALEAPLTVTRVPRFTQPTSTTGQSTKPAERKPKESCKSSEESGSNQLPSSALVPLSLCDTSASDVIKEAPPAMDDTMVKILEMLNKKLINSMKNLGPPLTAMEHSLYRTLIDGSSGNLPTKPSETSERKEPVTEVKVEEPKDEAKEVPKAAVEDTSQLQRQSKMLKALESLDQMVSRKRAVSEIEVGEDYSPPAIPSKRRALDAVISTPREAVKILQPRTVSAATRPYVPVFEDNAARFSGLNVQPTPLGLPRRRPLSAQRPNAATSSLAKKILDTLSGMTKPLEQQRRLPMPLVWKPEDKTAALSDNHTKTPLAAQSKEELETAQQPLRSTTGPSFIASSYKSDRSSVASEDDAKKDTNKRLSFSSEITYYEAGEGNDYVTDDGPRRERHDEKPPDASKLNQIQTEEEFPFPAPVVINGVKEVNDLSQINYVFSPPSKEKSKRRTSSTPKAKSSDEPKVAVEGVSAPASSQTFATSSQTGPPPPKTNPFAKFLTQDKVQCKVCLVYNEKSAIKCISCENELNKSAASAASSTSSTPFTSITNKSPASGIGAGGFVFPKADSGFPFSTSNANGGFSFGATTTFTSDVTQSKSGNSSGNASLLPSTEATADEKKKSTSVTSTFFNFPRSDFSTLPSGKTPNSSSSENVTELKYGTMDTKAIGGDKTKPQSNENDITDHGDSEKLTTKTTESASQDVIQNKISDFTGKTSFGFTFGNANMSKSTGSSFSFGTASSSSGINQPFDGSILKNSTSTARADTLLPSTEPAPTTSFNPFSAAISNTAANEDSSRKRSANDDTESASTAKRTSTTFAVPSSGDNMPSVAPNIFATAAKDSKKLDEAKSGQTEIGIFGNTTKQIEPLKFTFGTTGANISEGPSAVKGSASSRPTDSSNSQESLNALSKPSTATEEAKIASSNDHNNSSKPDDASRAFILGQTKPPQHNQGFSISNLSSTAGSIGDRGDTTPKVGKITGYDTDSPGSTMDTGYASNSEGSVTNLNPPTTSSSLAFGINTQPSTLGAPVGQIPPFNQPLKSGPFFGQLGQASSTPIAPTTSFGSGTGSVTGAVFGSKASEAPSFNPSPATSKFSFGTTATNAPSTSVAATPTFNFGQNGGSAPTFKFGVTSNSGASTISAAGPFGATSSVFGQTGSTVSQGQDGASTSFGQGPTAPTALFGQQTTFMAPFGQSGPTTTFAQSNIPPGGFLHQGTAFSIGSVDSKQMAGRKKLKAKRP